MFFLVNRSFNKLKFARMRPSMKTGKKLKSPSAIESTNTIERTKLVMPRTNSNKHNICCLFIILLLSETKGI
jgi:hypothetical protein